jgi:DNA-directed RNA polymerase
MMNHETNSMTLDEAIKAELLVARQIELEQDGLDDGIARYHRHQTQSVDQAATVPGQHMVREVVGPLADQITAMIERVKGGKGGRGRPSLAAKYLQDTNPKTIALLAARRIISGAANTETLTRLAMGVASVIEDHVVFETFRKGKETKKHYDRAVRRLKGKSHHGHRARVLRGNAGTHGVRGFEWSQQDKLHVGLKLVELFSEAKQGWIERETHRKGKLTVEHIRLTDYARDWLTKRHADCATFAPIHYPMVVPPRPWSSPADGGYLSKDHRLWLMKVRRRETLDELFNTDMPEVYAAINAIQSTPWRINKAVLGVMREGEARGMVLPGFAPADPLPIPARPEGIPEDVLLKELPEDQANLIRRWASEKQAVIERNIKEDGRRFAVKQALHIAGKVEREERIYFPHTMDFRGRVYPVPPVVNPQSDDLGRALIEFAEGQRLGESGGYWLAVHLANSFGFDKASFDERVEWTKQHSDQIMDSALRPLDGEMLWTQADNPWQFLAACFEWVSFMVLGEDCISYLPISMDATCSGLQHFSALLADPVGGAEVNVAPSPERHDIYLTVLHKVEALLLERNDELGVAWRGKVTRALVKQPTMTFAYSATARGMRDQINFWMQREGIDVGEFSSYTASNYLAPIVRQAIAETVVAATDAMAWLQDVAAVCAKGNLPVTWTTPLGLPVVQFCPDHRMTEVECNYGGNRLRLSLAIDNPSKQSRAEATSGVSPNFIHSLDSTHMMMTVNALGDQGVTSFAMIHDSFGVHAADVDLLHAVLREEFVRLYSFDHLAALRQALVTALPPELASELPECPTRGALAIESVRQSDFFFS